MTSDNLNEDVLAWNCVDVVDWIRTLPLSESMIQDTVDIFQCNE